MRFIIVLKINYRYKQKLMMSTNATEYCFINFTLQSLYLSMCLIAFCSTFVFKCYSTFHSCVSSLIKASTSLRHTCWRNFETQSKSVGKKNKICSHLIGHWHKAGLRLKFAKHYKNHIYMKGSINSVEDWNASI